MKKGKNYIGVAVGALIFNEEGKVLLGERGKAARDDLGKWDFPGGAVDFKESCEDAIKREVFEEFDIYIELIELLNLVENILPEEGKHWIGPAYIAKQVSGEVKIVEKDKFRKFEWIELKDITKKDLTLPCRLNFEAYKRKYGLKPITSKNV